MSVCLSSTFSDVCGHIPHCASLAKPVGTSYVFLVLRLQDARGSGFCVCQKRGLDPPSHHRNFVCVCAPSQRAFVVVTRCPLTIGKPCDVRSSDELFRDMCFTDLGSIVSSVAPCTSRSLWLAKSFRTDGGFSRRCRFA